MSEAASIKLYREAVHAQFWAAVEMLHGAITHCPDAIWTQPVGTRAYWEVAYHVAFYTHLYLTRPGEPWPEDPDWAWPHAAGMGTKMEPPFEPLKAEEIGPVLERDKVAEHVAALQPHLQASLAAETAESLAGESGFFWLTIPRSETYLYNMRHVQHHTGQLTAALRRNDVTLEVDWVGMHPM